MNSLRTPVECNNNGQGGKKWLGVQPFATFLGIQKVAQGHNQTPNTTDTARTRLGIGIMVPNTTPIPNAIVLMLWQWISLF